MVAKTGGGASGTKGWGLFAARDFPAGSKIIWDVAVLSISSVEAEEGREAMAMALWESAADLPRHLRKDLFRGAGLPPRGDKFWEEKAKYLFAVDVSCLKYFHGMSIVNHACVPNADLSYDPQSDTLSLYANRDIPKGAEITRFYPAGDNNFPALATTFVRQTYLKERFGFTCRCEGCESMAFRFHYLEDEEEIRELVTLSTEEQSQLHEVFWPMRIARMLLTTYEEIGITDARYGKQLAIAMFVVLRQADKERTVEFAQRALGHYVRCLGPDHPEVQHIKTIIEHPESHSLWGEDGDINDIGGLPYKRRGAPGVTDEDWLWDPALIEGV